jgi:hypothetical protein
LRLRITEYPSFLESVQKVQQQKVSFLCLGESIKHPISKKVISKPTGDALAGGTESLE